MAANFMLVFVLLTISIQRIFGFDCLKVEIENIMNCDQCIKCGGNWCINPKPDEYHCALKRGDTGCSSDDSEIYGSLPQSGNSQTLYSEDSIKVGRRKDIELSIPPEDEIDIKYTRNDSVHVIPKISDDESDVRGYDIEVDKKFCIDTGGRVQDFNVTFTSKNREIKKAKYYVACECACSKNVSPYDKYCSGRGNLTCGTCACDDRWEGKHCELEKPYDEREYVMPKTTPDCDKRGDANCISDLRPDVECSGNGKCGDCCVCDTDKDGAQYFIPEKYCEDLCMTTAELLKADVASPLIRFIRYNKTETERRDSENRKVWVKCNETIEEFMWEYYARKNVKGEIGLMILKKSSPEAAAIESGGVNVTALVVPLVVAAALIAAAVAYYVIKGQGAAPQPSRANYQGLDGPKTRVETNPVYIEPIKSYKNPTYVQNK